MSTNAEIAFFRTYAPTISENGFTPIPIRPRTKVTRLSRWQLLCDRCLTSSELQEFIEKYPGDGIALVCGRVLAVDIDSPDETRAAFLQEIAVATLGPTPLIRFGHRPKRMLIYRSADPYPRTRRLGDIEILGSKAYVLAFGIHPQTGRPYEWVDASPLTLRFDQIPAIGSDQIQALVNQIRPDLASAAQVIEEMHTTVEMPAQRIVPVRGDPWLRNRRGLIVDGRDPYLAHLVWTQAQATVPDARAIADAAWDKFVASADLTRNRRDGPRRWSRADALAKAQALLRSGKLSRPWQSSLSIDHSEFFWTPPTKNAFAIKVAQAGAMRFISPAAVKVSNQMLAVVHGLGECFLSTVTLARDTDLSIHTIKKSRRQLRQRGFWTSRLSQGGRGQLACYRPNPEALDRNFDEDRDPFDLKTVDVKGTQITREGRVNWDELLLFKKKNQIEIEALVDPCRPGTAKPFPE